MTIGTRTIDRLTIVQWCLGAALVMAGATPARAQMDPEPPPLSIGYVSFIGGSTVDTPRSAVLSAEYGERITDFLDGYASVTYVDNLMSSAMRDSLAALGTRLQAATGKPFSFTGRDRGMALTFGAKLLFPSGSPIHAYVGGGGGVLNLKRHITEATLGDVTESFVSQYGISDGNVPAGSVDSTMPVAEAIAGVNVLAGRAYVDLSYRYRHPFHTVNSISFSQISAGLGVRF